MPGNHLPILTLAVKEQRYSCHGCGNCCRDFTVQLREEDLGKLREQRWEEQLGEPVTIDFRGATFLRQRGDGACIFFTSDGRCRIHAEFGFEAKPIACQLFPFHLTPSPGAPGRSGVTMGINFACQSVLENKGAPLQSHVDDLGRMLDSIPEANATAQPPMLTDRLRATALEVEAITMRFDRWLKRADLGMAVRLDGLAWVVQSLAAAKLDTVRGRRFADLLDVLFNALPQELAHHPIAPPKPRQRKMLRRAVFTRTEDPKLDRLVALGRLATSIAQLRRQRRFASGRGPAPRISHDWPEVSSMESVDRIAPAATADHVAAIDDLMTRYLRASILGGRCWGAGYYAWPIVRGLQAMLLNVAVVGWLARLHAAGRDHVELDIIDVRAALGRVDRSSGRAKWLGSAGERLRLRYLELDDGLRRLVAAMRPVN